MGKNVDKSEFEYESPSITVIELELEDSLMIKSSLNYKDNSNNREHDAWIEDDNW